MNEGYLPLYRKYRPQKLEDIVGQAHVKRALTNAIELNKIAHAYLFTGPRGTGKTSTARILAKSLNCVDGPTVTPCEECESCKAITSTIPIDVIELDAASNRSVDDAREILEKVNYAPVYGKYKIYIIDEVHMLTDAAFNALLKTLEEPPKNVIFILATTESHKVMDTIKSRCQRFDFKRITTNDIIEHLRKIADNEGIKISDDAIAVIAKSSAGGMRDSLALLDQVSTLGVKDEISVDDINILLGRLSFDSLLKLSTSIVNSDCVSAIDCLEEIYNNGNEPVQILSNLLMFFKNVLVAKTCDSKASSILTGFTDEQLKLIEPIINLLEKHQIIFLINKTADYIKELKETTNQQMWLEVGLIDLANLADNTKLMELQSRIARLEGNSSEEFPRAKIISLPVKPVVVTSSDKDVKAKEPEPIKENVESEQPMSCDIESVEETPPKKVEVPIPAVDDLDSLWLKVLEQIPMSDGGGFAKMKAFTQLVKCDSEGVIVAVKKPLPVSAFNLPDKRKIMLDAFSKVLGSEPENLLIRERLPEDTVSKKKLTPQPKKQIITPPKDLINKEDELDHEELEFASKMASSNNVAPENISDQKKMVMDLFEAKILD